MGGPRSKANDDDLRAAWAAGETCKACAARLGLSPNTLRARWKGLYGEEAYTERGRVLQAAAAARTCAASVSTRTYRQVSVACSVCRTSVQVSSQQRSHMKDDSTYVCASCQGDRVCPVCRLRVDGARGLATHYRHRMKAGDAEHTLFVNASCRALEDARWSGKTESRDYLVCRECGLRAESLASHVRTHGLTADQYRAKHGQELLLHTESVRETIRGAVSVSHVDGVHLGTKHVLCPECENEWEAPMGLAPSMHDVRCVLCKALGEIADEEHKWEGKSEPSDYVTCRACGRYRAENLTSHLQNEHPDLVGCYTDTHVEALVMTTGSAQRVPSNKLDLTVSDLTPFMDAQGRVEVAKAASAFGCVHWTVLFYCKLHNLPTRNRLAFQKRVLDMLSEVLDEPYVWEWSHSEIKNPKTGYGLYYDGFFPRLGLLVEVHGKQHYEYIPYWHKSPDRFEASLELDALKVQRAHDLGFKLLSVKYDEPVGDPLHFIRRLRDELGLRLHF